MQSLEQHPSGRAVQSDAALIDGVQRRDQSALGMLYDRYAALVFTLAHSMSPNAAEALTERIFYRLWSLRPAMTSPGPLLHTLIDLTEQTICSEHVLIQGADTRLEALRPFAGLPPGIYEMMVLAYLGQLDALEIAVALNVSPAYVRVALTSGVLMLRSVGLRRDQVA